MSHRANERYTGNLIGALALAVNDRVTDAIEETVDIGGNAGAALVSIGTRPGEPIDQLAKVLRLSHSATVRVVDRLEQRRWVRRARIGHDGRSVSLELTKSGQTIFRRVLQKRNTVLNRTTDVLNDREVATLRNLAAKILASLPDNRAEARHICRLCEHAVCQGAACPVGVGG